MIVWPKHGTFYDGTAALNIYDDFQTRKWAGEVYQRIESVLGPKAVRGTWWNVADLGEPGVLAGAVSTAIRSDMIVVAVRSSEGLPLPFYFWVNAWLPHRVNRIGALVALLGAPITTNAESGRLRKYLRAVARRARMDLLVHEQSPNTCFVHPSLLADFEARGSW